MGFIWDIYGNLPSGNDIHSLRTWKLPSRKFVDLPSYNMVIFIDFPYLCYVSLPEGIRDGHLPWQP